MTRLCPLCGQRTEEARCPADGTATLVLATNPDSRLTEGAEVNGRYRISKLIGQGGFGAVYRATSLATGSEIAIKVLGVNLDNDEPELIQRFYAEAQITAALKHPNTIRVFDFGQTDGGALYIAMELLTGQALNELLRERRRQGKALDQAETARIGIQTLRSLAEAHQSGLVHRDLKPHNIFLNEVPGDDPVVKVLDFGIAKRLGSNLTGTNQAFGTPTYMSPEQAQNKGIDARSDLYSLGCVLYQCVAGAPPFEGDNPLSVLLSHVADTPKPLAQAALVPLSVDFVAVIERVLAKNPDQRFASAQEMRQALERISPAPTGLARAIGAGGSGDHESVRLDIDGDTGEDERTAAYQPAPAAVAATVTGGGRPVGATAAAGSGHTSAFLLGGEEATAAEPAPARKSGAGLVIAGVAALAVAGGVAALLLSSGQGPATGSGGAAPAPAAATASSAQPAAPQAAPAAEDASNGPAGGAAAAVAAAEGGADAAMAAATADVSAAAAVDAAPAVPTVVELKSEPSGAQVSADGKPLGSTPLPITVPPEGKVRAMLSLEGYRDIEVVIEGDQAPARTVTLSAEPKPKKPRPSGTRPHRPTGSGGSSLDERL